jgi:RNA polymerase sigma-70 factor, ECF subfamily
MKMRQLGNNATFKEDQTSLFEALVLPELGAAHRLARCLTGNSADAEDVVQNAMLRILRFLHSYRGGNVRAWVQRIMRNAALDWLRTNRRPGHVPIEGEMEGPRDLHEGLVARGDSGGDPAAIHLRQPEIETLRRAIGELPFEQRIVVQLRDVEGLSYREIETNLRLPPGTMSSRLLRAREQLEERCCLSASLVPPPLNSGRRIKYSTSQLSP